MKRIGLAERRRRLGVRHHLARSSLARDPVEATRGVVALHATDPASVFLSVHARTPPVSVAEIERALYDDRSLIRMIGMRRTMFVVPLDVVPVMQAACSGPIAAAQRRRYLQQMVQGGLGGVEWLADIEESTVAALEKRGSATAAQLSTDEPRLRSKLLMAAGKSYEGYQNITSWVLFLLAIEGRIIRGRPLGSWTGSQWRWSPTTSWIPGGIPKLSQESARVEWVRRWLAAFGPATVEDLRWWTGWTMAAVKPALAAIGPAEVDLDGVPGIALPDDLETTREPEPWISLLPALDPTAMGWKQRSWYLGDHAPMLFDRNGNVGPTIWSDGRIVGGWAQRPSGRVVHRLLEDVGTETAADVEAAAARLESWIGPVRVIPRFRTPLERELTTVH